MSAAFVSTYSARLLTELEPYYRIYVEDEALTYDQMLRTDGVKIVEEENKKTIFEFWYKDFERRHLYQPIFERGSKVKVDFGYRTDHVSLGPFTIEDVTTDLTGGGLEIKVMARSGGDMAKAVRSRVISSGTVSDLVHRVASTYGYTVNIEGDLGIPIDDNLAFVQTNESDYRFLQRVINQLGWTLTSEGETLTLLPPAARKNMGRVRIKYGRADANAISIKIGEKKPSPSLDIDDAGISNAQGKGGMGLSELLGFGGSEGSGSLDTDGLMDAALGFAKSATGIGEDTPPGPTGEKPSTFDRVLLTTDGLVRRVTSSTGVPAVPEGKRGPGSGSPGSGGESGSGFGGGRSKSSASSTKEIEVGLKLGSTVFKPSVEVEITEVGPSYDGRYRVSRTEHRIDKGFSTKIFLRSGWVQDSPSTRANSGPDTGPGSTDSIDSSDLGGPNNAKKRVRINALGEVIR